MEENKILIAENEGEVKLLTFDKEANEKEFVDDKNWKSSESYLLSNGAQARPTITITQRTIWVYHKKTGGGRVGSTRLRGSGGNYTFTQGNRSYQIEPGTYEHFVTGTIFSNGSIHSGIRYK